MLNTFYVRLPICMCSLLLLLSHFIRVQLFATLWTIACQAPLSLGFLSSSTGVGCHVLLQWIFPTQGSNPDLLLCRQILYH